MTLTVASSEPVIAELNPANGVVNQQRYFGDYPTYRGYIRGVEYNEDRDEVVVLFWSNYWNTGWDVFIAVLDPNNFATLRDLYHCQEAGTNYAYQLTEMRVDGELRYYFAMLSTNNRIYANANLGQITEINSDYEFRNAVKIGCPNHCQAQILDVDMKGRYYYGGNYHHWNEVWTMC